MWRNEASPFPSVPCRSEVSVRRVPLSAGDHRPRGPVVSAVRALLPRRRGAAGERGIEVDHVTIYRWVQRFTPLLADAAGSCRHTLGDRWFVDETYVKVVGVWRYVYRAVDQFGQIIDVLVSARRDLRAARRFFARALARMATRSRS